jgi:hypothetical protein
LADDDDDALSSEMSDIAPEDIAMHDAQLKEFSTIQQGLKDKRQAFGSLRVNLVNDSG